MWRLAGSGGRDSNPAPVIVQNDLRTGHPLLLEILPLAGAARDIFDTAAAIVFATDLGPGRPDRMAVRRAFGLTERETDLALALVEGTSLEEVALSTGRSIETVRSQLKTLFRKTATSRQTELVVRIGRFRRAKVAPR